MFQNLDVILQLVDEVFFSTTHRKLYTLGIQGEYHRTHPEVYHDAVILDRSAEHLLGVFRHCCDLRCNEVQSRIWRTCHLGRTF